MGLGGFSGNGIVLGAFVGCFGSGAYLEIWLHKSSL